MKTRPGAPACAGHQVEKQEQLVVQYRWLVELGVEHHAEEGHRFGEQVAEVQKAG